MGGWPGLSILPCVRECTTGLYHFLTSTQRYNTGDKGDPFLSAPTDKGGVLAGVFMPKGLRRRYGQGHLQFITRSCYRRLPLFASVRIDPIA